MTNQYSFLIGLEKTVVRMLIIAGPIVAGVLPEMWMNMTLGGLINLGLNYLKHRNSNEEVPTE